MKIENIDINVFGAKLLSSFYTDTEFVNSSNEWLRYGLLPFWGPVEVKFKTLSVELYFKAEDKETLEHNISNFLSKLTGPRAIELPDRQNKFMGMLQDKEITDTVKPLVKRYQLKFVGYEYGDQQIETLNRVTTKTINVPGNALTPCIVEITPAADIPDLTITGLGYDPQKDANQPIKFTKIQKGGQKVIVDGEKGLVTLADGTNKYGDTDLWLFPRLRPGANTITVSRNNVDITLRYCPRFI